MLIKIKEKSLRKIIKNYLKEELVSATGNLKGVVYGRHGSIGGGASGSGGEEKGDFGTLEGIKMEKISMSVAGKNASDLLSSLGGKKDISDESGGSQAERQQIVTMIHKPIFEACTGKDFNKYKDKHTAGMSINDYYTNNLHNKAWSSWFLNRCYLGSAGESEIKKYQKGFTHRGCCYPWFFAMKNRKNIVKNPESFVGKELLILATKEEVLSLGGFTDGDASVVGQGKDAPSLEWIAGQSKHGGGVVHMNVRSGSGTWIGGNLSHTVASSGDDTKEANAFMILVKVKGAVSIPDKEELSNKKEEEQST